MYLLFRYLTVLSVLLLAGGHSLQAQKGLRVSGKIRTLEPVEFKVEDIAGRVVCNGLIRDNEPFGMKADAVPADVYWICFGKYRQPLYLTGGEIGVKGFFNIRNMNATCLEFSGVEDHFKLMEWMPAEKFSGDRTIKPEIKGRLEGNRYSALAYIADMTSYAPNRLLLDCMDVESLKSLSGRWLKRRTDSLGHYVPGNPAHDFSLSDLDGSKVSLSDFKGKLVLLDFCASWCGPCRKEMKHLRSLYEELKGDDLVFLSISLDSREADWRKMAGEEKLPWSLLWDGEGFRQDKEHNLIQQAYGFFSIPFIVLIDGEGRLYARDLRGDKIREAVLEARKAAEGR